MRSINKWDIRRGVYRGFDGKPFGQSLSCGFINKSGVTTDVADEAYARLAMVYVLRGTGSYVDDHGIRLQLKAGDLFFRFPDRRHSSSVDPESQWLECFASVRSEWYDALKSIGLIKPDKVCYQIGEHNEIPERILRGIEQLEASDTALTNHNVEFELVSLIRQILTRNLDIPQTDSSHHKQLETARERIRTQSTQSLSLEDMFDDLGLSYSRLRNLFRSTYGISPGDYRIQVRIEQACALLETTRDSIQEIADQLGYTDAFTFSKQFKQRIGVAPNHFRNRKA